MRMFHFGMRRIRLHRDTKKANAKNSPMEERVGASRPEPDAAMPANRKRMQVKIRHVG